MEMPDKIRELVLYGWVGEDELSNSGIAGLKQAMTPAGCIPLAATTEGKLNQEFIKKQLQIQANTYGKIIRLCKFVFVEEVVRICPK